MVLSIPSLHISNSLAYRTYAFSMSACNFLLCFPCLQSTLANTFPTLLHTHINFRTALSLPDHVGS
jgi:hypothetical protein